MNPIFAAANEVQVACGDALLKFCFIGGLAVQRWGEPRMTRDVDMTLLTGFGAEEHFIDEMLFYFDERIPDAKGFALRNRVLLLKAKNGVPLDVSLGAMPFEERTIERSSIFQVAAGIGLRTCSAEDLIVHKVFAGRAKDWEDVRGIVGRQPALATNVIWDELLPLLELRDDVTSEPKLRQLLSPR
jgi:hypothetical protein